MANSIEALFGRVQACLEKWKPVKSRFGEKWHVFDLPHYADEQGSTVSAKRWEPWMMSREAGVAISPEVATEWAADWNALLDEWDVFRAAARAEILAILTHPVARGLREKPSLYASKRRDLTAAIAELLSRPSEPEPSQAHHEIWDRQARKRQKDSLQTHGKRCRVCAIGQSVAHPSEYISLPGDRSPRATESGRITQG